MATISFDSTFELKKECVDAFFSALEKNSFPPLPDNPYVNQQERERDEELLRKYYSR